MKYCFYIFTLVFFTSCSINQKNDSSPSPVILVSDSLDIELTKLEDREIIPGFAVAMVDADKILFQKTYGLKDIENSKTYTNQTTQIIASVSKTVIGVSLMQLVERGQLSLDDPINKYLPFEIKNPFYPEIDITIKMLATHTSSIDDYDDGDESTYWLIDPIQEPRSEIPKNVLSRLEYFELGEPRSLATTIEWSLPQDGRWYDQDNFYNYKPGSTMNYSNIGASLAAYIVERVSNLSFEDYTEEYVFNPLGMNNTAWHYQDLPETHLSETYITYTESDNTFTYPLPKHEHGDYPDGGMMTNIIDLSKYIQEMIRGVQGVGALMSSESYRILFKPQLEDKHYPDGRGKSMFNDEYNYGVFWGRNHDGYILHNGFDDGATANVMINPSTCVGTIAFSNIGNNAFGEILEIVNKYEQKLSSEKNRSN